MSAGAKPAATVDELLDAIDELGGWTWKALSDEDLDRQILAEYLAMTLDAIAGQYALPRRPELPSEES